MRRTFAVIKLANLKYNYLKIAKRAGDAGVLAVVKADAYGHGVLQCVSALESIGGGKPEMYGVALIEEAAEIRKAKAADSDILCFAPIAEEDLTDLVKYSITATIGDVKHLKILRKYSGRNKLKVQINIDTGMGRIGVLPEFGLKLAEDILKLKNIELTGIYTHFATSDEADKTFAGQQLKKFNNFISSLKYRHIVPKYIHAANSGAILDLPNTRFNLVRPGISLYGYYPSDETSESIPLKPVMELVSYVSAVKKISKGDSVSYGRKFIAEKDTRIATLPIGYADGVNRNLTNRMNVIINKKLYRQVGSVTMDRIMIDVGNDNVRIGSKAILLGESAGVAISAADWSRMLNTIPYEITCGISKRVPRRYIG